MTLQGTPSNRSPCPPPFLPTARRSKLHFKSKEELQLAAIQQRERRIKSSVERLRNALQRKEKQLAQEGAEYQRLTARIELGTAEQVTIAGLVRLFAVAEQG